ncbi:hypothetical protein AB0J52_05230 [Spirillospora sp. NPDC049652]
MNFADVPIVNPDGDFTTSEEPAAPSCSMTKVFTFSSAPLTIASSEVATGRVGPMLKRPSHSKSCENAELPACRCTGCGGSQHGWQGAIDIASDASGERLTKLVGRADTAWAKALRPLDARTYPNGTFRPSTRAEQQAAIQSARADVVSWLHRSPDRRADLERSSEPFQWGGHGGREKTGDIREFIEKRVVPELENEFGPDRVKQFQQRAVETHFWCELLAQTAWALQELKGEYKEAKEAVTTALATPDGTNPPKWARILPYEDVIKASVDAVWKQLPRAAGLPAAEDIFELIWPIRVLALLMCKDPSAHPAVREQCLNPVMRWGEVRMRDEVKDRLRWAFPDEWPSHGPNSPDTSK